MDDRKGILSESVAEEKGITENDVDPNELARGIEVEQEHTKDPELAKKIALDHLAEIPDYYSRLDTMEKGAQVQESAKKKKPIRDVVKRQDWQKLRESFKGTWMKTPEENCKKLRKFLGNIKTAEYDKLRIVMNYLTGTGFRTGRIKHKCIQAIRDDVSAEMKRRKNSNISESIRFKLDQILNEKIEAIVKGDEFELMGLDIQEHELLEQFVQETHLNVTSMPLSPREAKKVLQGEEVLIIRYQRDQDRYEANREYNAEALDGRDLGFRIQTLKVIQSTIDELQRRGAKNDIIDRMYEKGSFPDDQVDLVRIKKVQ